MIRSTRLMTTWFLLLSACATHAPVRAADPCPARGTLMARTDLYFGLSIPGGGTVSSTDWQDFLDREVTPRFPDGLTLDEASGQWRDAASGELVRESSRVVTLLHEASTEADARVESIRAAYKSRFHQDSVMRVDEVECVAF